MSRRSSLIKLPRGFRWIGFDVRTNMVILHCDHGLWTRMSRDYAGYDHPIRRAEISAICDAMAWSGVRGWAGVTASIAETRPNGECVFSVNIESIGRPARMYYRFDRAEWLARNRASRAARASTRIDTRD